MNSCRQTGRYGYGTGLTIGFVEHLLPHELFPRKNIGVFLHAGFDMDAMRFTSTTSPFPAERRRAACRNRFMNWGGRVQSFWIIIGYFLSRYSGCGANFTRNPLPIGLLAGVHNQRDVRDHPGRVDGGSQSSSYSFLPLLLVNSLSPESGEQPTFSYADAPASRRGAANQCLQGGSRNAAFLVVPAYGGNLLRIRRPPPSRLAQPGV